ncbi:uncharacterized protein [Clytia hemisphaerica]|uniref:CD36 family protein n=1 Tax=Clytia hemisphaerica TaxID=252671 RepID=A0A7M5WUG2_9CNID
MGQFKVIALILLGAISIILGVLLGRNLIPRVIRKTLTEMKCVDSIMHAQYKQFKGNASDQNDNTQIKVFHWNLTNKDDFLYNGATPKFEEIGPYVYTFGGEKANIQFTRETARYKSILKTSFSSKLTKQFCPRCQEDDMFVNVNMGYIGVLQMTGAEDVLAYSLIPPIIGKLLLDANDGNLSTTYQSIGMAGQSVLPANVLPNDFKIDFSAFLSNVMNVSSASIQYTETQMRGLYNVVTNATLLGVSGAAPSANCSTDPSQADCLQMGFLVLANWMSVRSAEVVADGKNVTDDATFLALYGAIGALFCPNTTYTCLDTVSDVNMIGYIVGYVTQYLPQIVIELAIDHKNYGLLTQRTHKEIASGYFLTELVFPGFERGIPVPGFVPNDADVDEALKTKLYNEVYTCGVPSKTEFTWAKADDASSVPSSYFPGASKEFLEIDSKFTATYFGTKPNLDICKTRQSAPHESYKVYDNTLKGTYILRRTLQRDYLGVNVHDYEMDLEELYKVDDVAVFTRGLRDMTKSKNNVPMLFSQPHYLMAESIISDTLGMKPDKIKHQSLHSIEPITGSAIEVVNRLQLNTYLTPAMLSSPRMKPYNVSYVEHNTTGVTKPFPILWMETHAFATAKELAAMDKLLSAVRASCMAIVIGPLIGVIIFLIAGYCYWKRVKRGSSVDASEVGKSTTSM